MGTRPCRDSYLLPAHTGSSKPHTPPTRRPTLISIETPNQVGCAATAFPGRCAPVCRPILFLRSAHPCLLGGGRWYPVHGSPRGPEPSKRCGSNAPHSRRRGPDTTAPARATMQTEHEQLCDVLLPVH